MCILCLQIIQWQCSFFSFTPWIHAAGKHFQQKYKHEICTITFLFVQNVGGDKRYSVLPFQKLGGTFPPINLVPAYTPNPKP